jgi:hypothetical protein
MCNSLNILQTEAKASSDNAAQMLEAVKHELKNEFKNTADTINAIAANVQLNIRAGEAVKTAAKEAVEVGKANLQMARQMSHIWVRGLQVWDIKKSVYCLVLFSIIAQLISRSLRDTNSNTI